MPERSTKEMINSSLNLKYGETAMINPPPVITERNPNAKGVSANPLLSDVADLESIKNIRESDFILKLFYHCQFCLAPNDPENNSQFRFIVCQEQLRHDGIYYTIAKHKCGECGKINKFLIK